MFGFPFLPCSMILLVRAVVLFQSAGGSNLDQQISQHAKLLSVSLSSMECLESDSGRLTGHPSSLFCWYKDMSWRGTFFDACCLTLYIYFYPSWPLSWRQDITFITVISISFYLTLLAVLPLSS